MKRSGWIWFDFENTPHVLFLEPFIRRLEADSWTVLLTAKPQAQTTDLAWQRGLPVEVIGSGEHASRWSKVIGGVARAIRLASWVTRTGRPRILISSSRTASLAAAMLRIPAVSIMDYEHAEHRTIAWASQTIWLPDALQDVLLPVRTQRVARFFEGLKENLYLDSWVTDREKERRFLGVQERNHLIVARPPASTAHYASEMSGRLWTAVIEGLWHRPGTVFVVVPRNAGQAGQLRGALGGRERVRILESTVTGPALVSAADLVIGGGGTMNREAAVLGVPVWSVFTGPSPRIDQRLAEEGRLRWVRTEAELSRVLAGSLPKPLPGRGPFPAGFNAILQDIRSHLGDSQEGEG